MNRTLRVVGLFMVLAPLAAVAQVFNLADDFSYPNNPTIGTGWSYIDLSTASPLSPQVPLNNGNPLYPAVVPGFFSTGPNLNADTPMVIKASVNGSAAGETDTDFLAGDVIIHSPNTQGNLLAIQWTAPSDGVIQLSSDIWYAHSLVNRANDVVIKHNLAALDNATISKTSYGSRTNAWHVEIADLAVAGGDQIQFLFSKTAGQQFGSLNGIAATIDFTAIPEPGTALLVVLACGVLGMVTRRRP